jgi:sensor c-di-GMP phosphodiesterase-like protein
MKFFIELAHNLHLIIVFEGIEEETQKELLRQYEADGFQGYLYAKPMPTQKLITFYQEQEKNNVSIYH